MGLLDGEIGYEHHFMNYLLYLPYSNKQEEDVMIESIKKMKESGISNIKNQEDLDKLLKKINNVMEKVIAFNNMDNNEIKKRLNECSRDDITKDIIHGDYKYKNENVEVFLHQRTMKKIKYKKREYDSIHPIDTKVIDNVRYKILEDLNNVNVNDRLIRKMTKIKKSFNL